MDRLPPAQPSEAEEEIPILPAGIVYLDRAAEEYPHLPPAKAIAYLACIDLGIPIPETPETKLGLAKDSAHLDAKRIAWDAMREARLQNET